MTNEPTRERLERALSVFKLHHKMLVNEIDGMTHDINESIDAFAVGIALANAELERQSVTDEDVAEAIEWLDEDRRNLERKVAQTSSFNAGILRRELNRVRLAIQALQAYRPEREPCDWCEAQMQNVMGYVQYGCYRLDASCWNFCPVCGRKLEKCAGRLRSRSH